MMTIEEIRDLLAETAKISQKNSKGLKGLKRLKKGFHAMKEQAKISQEREEKKLKALQRLVGSIANNQADMVEEFVYNTIDYHHKKLFGIQFDEITKNIHSKAKRY